MKFKIRSWIYPAISIPVLMGIYILFGSFADWSTKTEQQKDALNYLIPIILIFFFGIPFVVIRQLKTVIVDKNFVTFKFPYGNKEVVISKDDIHEIIISENLKIKRFFFTHQEISIRTKANTKQSVSSLDIEDFQKLRHLVQDYFPGLITVRSYKFPHFSERKS